MPSDQGQANVDILADMVCPLRILAVICCTFTALTDPISNPTTTTLPSLGSMNRTQLWPTVSDISSGDPYLPELVRYARHLTGGPDTDTSARNASVVYLAVITAFAAGGLMQVEWAPRLLIDINEREFEVRFLTESLTIRMLIPLPQIILHQAGSTDVSPAGVTDVKTLVPASPSNSISGSIRTPGSKVIALLDALEAHPFTVVDRQASGQPGRGTTGSIAGIRTSDHSGAIELDNDDAGHAIIRELHCLQSLDSKAGKLSIATNWAYWRLGQAYQAFVEVRSLSSCGSPTEAIRSESWGDPLALPLIPTRRSL